MRVVVEQLNSYLESQTQAWVREVFSPRGVSFFFKSPRKHLYYEINTKENAERQHQSPDM